MMKRLFSTVAEKRRMNCPQKRKNHDKLDCWSFCQSKFLLLVSWGAFEGLYWLLCLLLKASPHQSSQRLYI